MTTDSPWLSLVVMVVILWVYPSPTVQKRFTLFFFHFPQCVVQTWYSQSHELRLPENKIIALVFSYPSGGSSVETRKLCTRRAKIMNPSGNNSRNLSSRYPL